MAFGYWQHKGVTTKRTFLCFDEAYHGDTLGAVSVGGMDLFHEAYRAAAVRRRSARRRRRSTGSIEAVERILARARGRDLRRHHRAARASRGRDAHRTAGLPAQGCASCATGTASC